MEKSRVLKGRRGEEAAAEFLIRKGMKIIDRNFRCPVGEIDIIAMDAAVVVFVEVRSRTGSRFGGPEESIDAPKRRKIVQTAQWYLKKRGLGDSPARIDVVAIRWRGDEPEVNWIVNAFGA